MIKNCRSRLNWSGWQICSVDVTNSTPAPFDFVPLFLHLVLSLLTVVDFLAIALSSAVNRRFSIGFSSGFRVCHFIISGLTAARKCFPGSAEWLRSIVLHKYCWLIRRWCQGGNNLCWRSFIGTLAFTLLRGCVRGSNFAAENIHQTINLPPPNLTGFFTLVWVHLFSSFSAEHDACCVNLLLYQFLCVHVICSSADFSIRFWFLLFHDWFGPCGLSVWFLYTEKGPYTFSAENRHQCWIKSVLRLFSSSPLACIDGQHFRGKLVEYFSSQCSLNNRLL